MPPSPFLPEQTGSLRGWVEEIVERKAVDLGGILRSLHRVDLLANQAESAFYVAGGGFERVGVDG